MPSKTDTPEPPPSYKILLVEDDMMIQELYATVFRFRKMTIELADDGEDGLQKIRLFKPEVILLDVMMPKMNGLQMLELLKKDPDTTIRDIPVIMLTNLADETDVQKALKLGALKYVIKSDYIPRQVVDLVIEAMAQHKLG